MLQVGADPPGQMLLVEASSLLIHEACSF